MFSISDAQVITDTVLRKQIEQHPRAQELLRAFLYPYGAPDQDFLFSGGTVAPIDPGEVKGLVAGRRPVLAVGSNRAPVQLTRKFTHQNVSDEIPVTLGWLANHDIVYSTHVTGYGAIPATLASSPGTRARVAITWLTPRQLSHMHVTESVPSHYSFRQLHGRDITLDCTMAIDQVGLYQSAFGHVFDDGKVFALAAVKVEARRFIALEQWEMIEYLAHRTGHVLRPDFALQLIDDPILRKSMAGLALTK